MSRLEDDPHADVGSRIARYRKTDGIAVTVFRQARASDCVTEVAIFFYFFGCGDETLMPRRSTAAIPSRTKRQSRWMKPRDIFRNIRRNKKWAGQVFLSTKTLELHQIDFVQLYSREGKLANALIGLLEGSTHCTIVQLLEGLGGVEPPT
jgi:hypothetical protein